MPPEVAHEVARILLIYHILILAFIVDLALILIKSTCPAEIHVGVAADHLHSPLVTVENSDAMLWDAILLALQLHSLTRIDLGFFTAIE